MGADDDWFDETPVEETPGYIGHTFDEYVHFADQLTPLSGFNFKLYGQMADDLDALERRIEVDFGDGVIEVSVDAYALNSIVSALPDVSAIYDCPPDQGPCGGAGFIFLEDDVSTLGRTKKAAQVLRAALDADFAKLSAEYEKLQ